MAIYPLQQIPIAPMSETLRIVNKQSNQASPYSGRQTIIQFYASWTLSINWARMGLDKAEPLAAWLDSLQGAYGSFYYTPVFSVYDVGVELSLASDTYATSNVASISGWAANAPTKLRVGQYISIDKQLLRIAATPLAADSTGKATVEFNPPLRASYGTGTTVVTAYPRGVFRLDQRDGSGFQLDPDRIPEFTTLNAIEVI
jgi:hypothetical protein